MNDRSTSKAPRSLPATDPEPATDPDESAKPTSAEPELAEGAVEERDSSGGPGTVGWWLDDGPTSPMAADIEKPERHL